uniref:EF hand family protein n=1 Tax=Haemonchus contortus TaxID=6289 RepID=A0A7I4YD43_HAECO|nr:EF hand domain containing protein [Haemonchus contortus]
MMRFLFLAATTTLIYAVKDLSREPLENVNSFDSVDTDNNGAITYNEFEKWYKKTQHESNDVKIKNLFHKFDASRDQVLDVAEFVPLAYEISRKPVDTAEEIFKRMDLNHDNVIDTNEAAISRKEYGAGIIDSVLAVADVNGDGQLTYEEFKAQLDYNRPKSRKEANKEMAYKVLNYIDQNRDGKLSAQEIRNFSSLYNKLSDAEITQVISTLDVDKDGFLTVHELERIPGKIAEVANIQPPPTV